MPNRCENTISVGHDPTAENAVPCGARRVRLCVWCENWLCPECGSTTLCTESPNGEHFAQFRGDTISGLIGMVERVQG